MEDLVNPWKGRRVFLTGHTGFKGGWLALWLASRGAVIRGYALDSATEPNYFTVARIADVLDDVRGDIRDAAGLTASLTEFKPEVVFHLAAQPLVRRSYADPIGTYSTNVMGTAHVLEAARKAPSVRAIVCVTTDKCYRQAGSSAPFNEEDALGGYDPYSSSKACAEIVSAAYRSSYFPVDRLAEHHVAVATARAGNVIGGGDWSEDRLIPDLVRGFMAKEEVMIRRPKAIRPWQHVLESLQGYILLAEGLLAGRADLATAFNFGPCEEPWAVERIATRMVEVWGDGASWALDSEPSVHEEHCLMLDVNKARAGLGWQPRLDIATALEWTVDWYRRWAAGADMAAESLRQIDEYKQLRY